MLGAVAYLAFSVGVYAADVFGVVIAMLAWWVAVAVQVRRLHDLNRTGWYTLLVLVPIVQFLMLLWLGFWPSARYSNRFDTRSYYNGDVPRTN